MLVRLEQFAPDADFSEPGVIVDCQNLVPSFRGYKAAPTATNVGYDALAGACYGAAVVRKLDNSIRYIAGTADKLYEYSSGWVDRSGSAYSATGDSPWDFAQFGNVTIAATKANTLQYSTTGAFADIATAPKAGLVETVNQFVIVADTNDVGFGDSPDRWWCCAIGDYTDWTPDVATQCVSARLTSAPGKISALKRFGDGIVAFKDRAMYIGSYVGAPDVWSFLEIPGQVGCPARNGVVDIGAAIIFVGYDNFYLYDGSRPVAIGNPLKDWFYSNLYTDYAYRIQTVHDRENSNVYFFYPSSAGAGALDSCVVYNYRAQKWGVDDRTIEVAIDFVTGGLTFASTFATTYTFASVDASTSFDSPFLVAGQPAPAYMDTSHVTQSLTGVGGSWSLTTNDFGDDNMVLTLKRVRPRFLAAPTTCTLTNYYRMVMGDSPTQDATTTYSNGKFDVLRGARWHKLQLDGTGGGEITGLDVQAVESGSE